MIFCIGNLGAQILSRCLSLRLLVRKIVKLLISRLSDRRDEWCVFYILKKNGISVPESMLDPSLRLVIRGIGN